MLHDCIFMFDISFCHSVPEGYTELDGECVGDTMRQSSGTLTNCIGACSSDATCLGVAYDPNDNRCFEKAYDCLDPTTVETTAVFFRKPGLQFCLTYCVIKYFLCFTICT